MNGRARISRKFLLDIVLGVLLPLSISFLAFWRIFTAPGFILYWDMAFNYDLSSFFYKVTQTWNWYGSTLGGLQGTTAYLWMLGFMVPYWLGCPADLSEKLWLLQNYALVGIFMYFAMRILLPKGNNKLVHYGSCVVASLCYMLSKPIFTQLAAQIRILSSAAVPITIALYVKTLGENRNVLRNSVLTVVAITLVMLFEPLLLLTLIVLCIYQLYKTVNSRENRIKTFLADLKRDLLIVTMFVLININWFLMQSISLGVLGYFVPHESALMPQVGLVPSVSDGQRMGLTLLKMLTLDKWFERLPENALTWSVRFLIPVMAFSSVLLYAKEKGAARRLVISHALLSVLSMILATRSPPFDSLALFIMRITHATGMIAKFWTEPSGFIFLQCYGYAFLIAAFAMKCLTWIDRRVSLHNRIPFSEMENVNLKKRVIQFFHKKITVTCLTVIIVTSPMLLYTSYPASGNLNNHLIPTEVPQEYRDVNAWLREREGLYRVWWVPESLEVMFHYTWAPQPFTGGWVLSTSSKPYFSSALSEYLYQQGLLERRSNHVGKILSIAGVKYIILHADLQHSQYVLPNIQELNVLSTSLQHQKDLEMSYNTGFIYVFENKEYVSSVYASPEVAIVVGDVFTVLTSLAELDNFYPRDYVLASTEQLSSSYIEQLLPLSSVVIFSGHKGLEDLYLQLDKSDFVYPAKYTVHRDPSEAWSYTEAGIGGYSVATSDDGAALNVAIDVESPGTHELWVRVLRSPTGGEFSVYLDGAHAKTINTSSSYSHFKWEKIGCAFLKSGDHAVTLKNEKGGNTVNVILLAPSSELDNLRTDVLNTLQGKEVIVVESKFTEATYSETSLYRWDVSNDTLQEINQLPSVSANAEVVSFTMPFPGKYVITVNASDPFTLIIPENYNPLWRVTNVDGVLHFPAYSFLNGYHLDKTGQMEIVVEYVMNNPFRVGAWITALSWAGIVILLIVKESKIYGVKLKNYLSQAWGNWR